MTIGETYEDELNASEWADLDGKKQPWGPIPFEPAAVVSDVPLDDWKPTREEFEGYTGNAGNTLDRWYHRSAVVVWHRDHHYEVLTAAGARDCVPLFKSMVAKLARTPKKRLDAARTECVRFAHAIVDRWPERGGGFWRSVAEEASPNDFPDSLLLLHDRDTVARFLATAADRDQTLRLGAFIREACREFGWGAFAKELKHLLVAKPAKYPGREDRTIPFRDIEWLSEVCCDPATGPDRLALAAELCGRVVERFCALRPPRRETDSYYYGRPEPSITKDAMPLLVEAVAAGRDELLTKVVEFIQSLPQEFNLDDYQVPTLKDVIPWSQKRFGSVPPPLAAWLSAVRRQLEAATAQPPTRPANWARPAEVACTCQYCSRLNAFLADPASPATNIPAPEDQRQHLAGMISRHQCDVEHTLKREGRPYSLALTKTYGSFKRAVARFEADGRLLRALPAAD